MNFDSVVHDGRVVLEVGNALPEGTAVRATIVSAKAPKTKRGRKPTQKWLLKFSGIVKDMPSDFAEQHDHYIHGTPKR